VVVGEPETPRWFLILTAGILSQPTWLKPHLEKACKVMVARAAAASKYRKKCKKPEKPM
jgi:hypothetical protein